LTIRRNLAKANGKRIKVASEPDKKTWKVE